MKKLHPNREIKYIRQKHLFGRVEELAIPTKATYTNQPVSYPKDISTRFARRELQTLRYELIAEEQK